MRTWQMTRIMSALVLTSVLAACSSNGGVASNPAATSAPTSIPATAAPLDSTVVATTEVVDPTTATTVAPAEATTTEGAVATEDAATTAGTESTVAVTAEATAVASANPDATTVATISSDTTTSADTSSVATTAPVETATVVAEAATAAPDRWAEYAQWTIEGLRARTYGEGEIEIVQTLEETANFTRYLIAYPSDGLRITGMLNRPRGDGPFPVVILNHGYYPLDVYQTGNGTKLAADYLANTGFMTLSPDFRSHADSDDAPNQFRAGHVIDVLNLIPMAQRLPSARPGKVGMWGHSNGGAITSKAIAVSDQIAAALIYAPASSNIVEDYQFRVERSAARGTTIDRVEWPVLPEEGPDLYERLSPLPSLGYVTAPVQIHWGTNDETVPRKWPEDLYIGLQNAGKTAEWFEYAGEPHSFTAAGNGVYLPRMVEFFRQYVQ